MTYFTQFMWIFTCFLILFALINMVNILVIIIVKLRAWCKIRKAKTIPKKQAFMEDNFTAVVNNSQITEGNLSPTPMQKVQQF